MQDLLSIMQKQSERYRQSVPFLGDDPLAFMKAFVLVSHLSRLSPKGRERIASLLPSVCFALHRYLTVIAWGSAATRLFYMPRRLKMRAPHVKQHTYPAEERETLDRD